MDYGPRPHPAFFGLALITVGVLFLLREMDLLPDVSMWTLVWLGLGGWLFVGTLLGNRKGWFWPLTLMAIGGYMLLRDLGHLSKDVAVWPVVVIAIGISILLEAMTSSGSEDHTDDPGTFTIE